MWFVISPLLQSPLTRSHYVQGNAEIIISHLSSEARYEALTLDIDPPSEALFLPRYPQRQSILHPQEAPDRNSKEKPPYTATI